MPNSDFTDRNRQLAGDPGYQAALQGRYNPYGFPTGPDGLVLPGFRREAARAYVDARFGRQAGTPAGAIRSDGTFYDPNDEPWYADPRIMGPIAVGAAGGLGAAFGGAASSGAASATGAAAGGTLPSSIIAPTAGTLPAGGTGLAAGAGGTSAAAGGATAASTGATAASTGSALARTMRALGAAAPVVGMLTQRNAGGDFGSNVGSVMDALPQLRQLLDLQLGQAQRADPLHESLVRMSQRLLPNSAR